MFNLSANQETKNRVVKNIEKANGRLYTSQVAQNAIFNNVIDEMQNDPFWSELLEEYANNPQNAKKQTVKTGFSLFSIFKK